MQFAEREYPRSSRKYEKVWEANNLWLRGAHNKRRIAAEEETDRKVYLLLKFFSLCFWLDPKASKDQAPRKAPGDGDRGVFAGGGKNPKKIRQSIRSRPAIVTRR
ncbi:hypothetical protein F2S57_15830 [Alistipes onderdonkii]|nr:hypothetical protein F2S57_15830 [Alistipes onderdonkii]